MISRRLLRIKVLQVLYAYYKSDDYSLYKTEKELAFSIQKSYDLYHAILLLLIELADYAHKEIEQAKQKRLATDEELNPNMRFVENQLLEQIRNTEDFTRYVQYHTISWNNHNELIKHLFREIQETELYQNYMTAEKATYNADKQLIFSLLAGPLVENDFLHQSLEDQSIFWNDDLEFVLSMIIKTLKRFNKGNNQNRLMDLYKSEDDQQFAPQLLKSCIKSYDNNLLLIDQHTKNWDVERIAFMDILILQMAIVELTDFPTVPTNVTFNEYIEISKFYSTPKSSNFINGVLDKIVSTLRSKNRIKKYGRGLVGGEKGSAKKSSETDTKS